MMKLHRGKVIWKRFLCITAAVCLIIAQAGCAGKKEEPVTKQSFYFDTICAITIYDMKGMTQENAAAVIDDAFSLCSHYESLLSRTKEGTDIYRINHANGEPVECDAETIEILEKGLQYCVLSGGRFDITIGKVTDLWDFHSETPQIPDAEELAKATASVDYHSVLIDTDNSTVSLLNPDAEIDLGGIAKGFIADKVGEHLRKEGVTSAIISLGGNITCVGGKLDGGSTDRVERENEKKGEGTADERNSALKYSDFTIGIEKPFSNQMQIVGTVDTVNGTVVTSGIYERYFVSSGKLYHHILDATTGYPADTDVIGVTIRSEDGNSADCDALATICTLLGSEEGMKLIEGMDGYEATFITRGEEAASDKADAEKASGEAADAVGTAENSEAVQAMIEDLIQNEIIQSTEGMDFVPTQK